MLDDKPIRADLSPGGYLDFIIDGQIVPVGKVRVPGERGVGIRSVDWVETEDGVQAHIVLTNGKEYTSPVARHGEDAPDRSDDILAECIDRIDKRLEVVDEAEEQIDEIKAEVKSARAALAKFDRNGSSAIDKAKAVDADLRKTLKTAEKRIKTVESAQSVLRDVKTSLTEARRQKKVMETEFKRAVKALPSRQDIMGQVPTVTEVTAKLEPLVPSAADVVAQVMPRLPKKSELKGEPGKDAPPLNIEYDDVKRQFRLGPVVQDGKRRKWSKWMYLGSKLVRESRPTTGHGTLLQERDIIRLIERNSPVAAIDGYTLSDEESPGTTDYFGYIKPADSSEWYIREIDHSADPITHRFATTRSNGGLSYADAWANRATLTYRVLSEVQL